jgi:hypothetical protein
MPKPLPSGVQNFRTIIEEGYLYIDKTQLIYELLRQPTGVYFLSRPRRFGKSVLISTLEELFRGNKEIFRDLWLYSSDYAWPNYPVMRFDFSLERVRTAEEMKEVIGTYLQEIADQSNIKLKKGNYQRQFRWLIQQLAEQSAQNRVVILVDEYDYPIIDNIENVVEAQQIRDVLKGFYTVVKALDRHVRFFFLTGVTKFSRVGVFSGLNNLTDLSMDMRFAALPGITRDEVVTYLGEYLQHFAQHLGQSTDQVWAQMEHWYNGFRFSKSPLTVYNPFSLLQLLTIQEFRNYWFESGTPTFLISLIKSRNYQLSQIDSLQLEEIAFSTYELEQLEVLPMLFQSGYLTIKSFDPQRSLYTLDYPNFEVENSFLSWLLGAFSEIDHALSTSHLWRLIDALLGRDLPAFFTTLRVFFSQIPYDLQVKREQYYQTIFYLIFSLIGLRVAVEKHTNQGRIDTVVELAADVYLFEFKLDGSEVAALQQIKDKRYAEAYHDRHKTIHLVGVNFDSTTRTVVGWQEEIIVNR